MEETQYVKGVKKYIVGTVMIIGGLLLFGFNFGWLPQEYKPMFFSWPMLLIVFGIINLADKCNSVFGALLTLVGVIFLLPRIPGLGITSIDGLFWPTLLIGAGVFIISKRLRKKKAKHWCYNIPLEKKGEDGFLHEKNVFGGNKKVIIGEFRGGKTENFFGGSDIDLTQCYLPPGKHILEVECIFGGVELRVPPDWKVTVDVNPVMGGFHDKRKTVSQHNSDSELIIKGAVLFGGGVIKS
ncbi:MAG: cell wall-active antibiotics response protein [Cytophagaceae bacterium]|jgi:predicted membrane protein|nr:cell wall-active antibiotics response protein [Cytophagaceae bacterium]